MDNVGRDVIVGGVRILKKIGHLSGHDSLKTSAKTSANVFASKSSENSGDRDVTEDRTL